MPSTPTPENPWVPVIDGQALRRARADAGLTQRELIEKCAALGTKVDKGNLHRTEHGLPGAIGIRKARVVARALGTDVTAFLTPYGLGLIGRGRISPRTADGRGKALAAAPQATAGANAP